MRRVLPCLVTLILIGAMAIETFAQDSRRGAKTEKTSNSIFGGAIELTGVFREDWFDRVFPRSGNPTTPQDEGFLAAQFAMNARVQPAESVTLFLELRTAPDPYAGENHRVGDNNNIPQFREAWIKVEDLFTRKETDIGGSLQVGLLGKDFAFDLRNLGRDVFFMDPMNSENPFTGLPGLPANAGGTGGTTSSNTFLGGNAWVNGIPGILKESEAGGLKFTVNPLTDIFIDLCAFTVMEGGITDSNLGTNVVLLNFDFQFDLIEKDPGLKKTETYDDRSLFNLMFTLIQGNDVMIGDGGLGLDLLLDIGGADLEIYVEGHYQNGEYYRTYDIGGNRITTMQEAYAGYGGLRLLIRGVSGMDPYFDVSGWFVSGDNGDVDEKNMDYLSFESVNTTFIMESDFGLDIDCNYWAIKGEIGTKFPEPADNLKLALTIASFNLVKVPVAWENTDQEDHTRLGWEVDARLIWAVSEDVELFLIYAYLGDTQFFTDVFGTTEYVNMAGGGLNAKF